MPSLTTLHRLCTALQVSVAVLMDAQDDGPCTVYAPRDRPRTSLRDETDGNGSTAESLVPYAEHRRLEAMIVSLPPQGPLCGPFVHDGEEVGLVLDGELELVVDGTFYSVPTGSSFFLHSDRPHGYRATGAAPCRIVWVNTPPTF